ncbi:MAG: nitroreductase family protein [Bacteroidales bacterium]|nr:nitroreductase family protein [Bacteroidales bacterium]
MLKTLINKNRSYRRFYGNHKISFTILRELVDLARLSPSAANLQPLKFYLSSDTKTNKIIFPTLAWAGYIKDWGAPVEEEKPSAYIIILGDKNSPKKIEYDVGIAAQSILLGAVEKALGGCIIGSIKRNILSVKLNIPDKYEIMLIIALGKPKEKVVIETVKNNDVKYWRDEKEIHHVPKRNIDDLIIKNHK